jgi:hypothetical protein
MPLSYATFGFAHIPSTVPQLDSCRFIRKQEYFNNFKRLGAIE